MRGNGFIIPIVLIASLIFSLGTLRTRLIVLNMTGANNTIAELPDNATFQNLIINQTLTIDNETGVMRAEDGLVLFDTNSSHIEYKDNETLLEILDDTINPCILDAISVSSGGGLVINWTAGEIYNGTNVIETVAGGGSCVNNVTNYLFWRTGTSLTLSTTQPLQSDIPVAHIGCQNFINWELHEEEICSTFTRAIQHGLAELIPVAVSNGLLVSEDTNVTNPFDVQLSSGEYYHDAHAEHIVDAIFSRNQSLVRWFHSGGNWVNDTSVQINTTQYDDGTDLTAISLNQWTKSLFFVTETQIHWVYPQAEWPNFATALLSADPTMPTGLESFPKSTTLIMRQGDAAFPSASSGQWLDIRPILGVAGTGAAVSDHGSLSGLGDDDHPQYLLIDGTRAMSGNLDIGSNQIDNVANGTAAQDAVTLSQLQYYNASNPLQDLHSVTSINGSTTNDVSVGSLNLTGGVTGSDPDPTLRFSDYYDSASNASVSHISLGFGDTYGFGISPASLDYVSFEYHRFYDSDDLSSSLAQIDTTSGLTLAGDIQVGGNDIKDSGSNIALSFDGSGNVDNNAIFTGSLTTEDSWTFRESLARNDAALIMGISEGTGPTDWRLWWAPMNTTGDGFDFNREFGWNQAGAYWYVENDFSISGDLKGSDINLGWSNLTNYPSACSAGDFVTTVGDTLTCDTPSYTVDTDTNASTECSGANVLLGNGTCIVNWDGYEPDTNETTRMNNIASFSCSGDDKVSSFGADATPVCTSDTDTTYWSRDASNGRIYPATLTDNVGVKINTPDINASLHVADGMIGVTTGSQGTNEIRVEDSSGDTVLAARGSTSDFAISIQDGNGRVQYYWNVEPQDETYLVSSEEAGVFHMTPPGGSSFDEEATSWISFSYGSGGTAGDPVTWANHFSIGIDGTVYIPSGTDAAGGTADSGYLNIGDTAGAHVAYDDNEIQAKASATTTARLYLNNDGGAVSTGSTLYVDGTAIYVNYDGADADSSIYFWDSSSPSAERIYWDDGNSRFRISDELYIATDLTTGDDIFVNGEALYMGNQDGADQYIYFYNGGSATGESIKWDESSDRFESTDNWYIAEDLTVNGNEIAGSGGNVMTFSGTSLITLGSTVTMNGNILRSGTDNSHRINMDPGADLVYLYPGDVDADNFVLFNSGAATSSWPRILPSTDGHGYLGSTANTWNIVYAHVFSDQTCAAFDDYTTEELYNIVSSVKPRDDGIMHNSEGSVAFFPHINMSALAPEIAMITPENSTTSGLYKLKTDVNKTSGFTIDDMETEKVVLNNTAGDTTGIDLGTLVYTINEFTQRIYEENQLLETQVLQQQSKIDLLESELCKRDPTYLFCS